MKRRLVLGFVVALSVVIGGGVASAQEGGGSLVAVGSGTNLLAPVPTEAAEVSGDRTLIEVSGADDFEVAAAMAEAFDPGVPAVYVATREVYADALSGGPLAAMTGGPILLVDQDDLPQVTADAIQRLEAGSIVVLGGPAAISDGVVSGLEQLSTADVSRVFGPNRWATAAAISEAGWPDGAGTVYVATGTAFPDAMVGGVAAALDGAPVLLVRPDDLPAETVPELERLAPDEIVVLGGEAAVSADVVDALGAFAPVQRLEGPNRYGTAAAVAADAFTDAPQRVYLASGEVFTDALVTVPVAASGANGFAQGTGLIGPILLAESDRLPSETAEYLGANQVPGEDGSGGGSTPPVRTTITIVKTTAPAEHAQDFDFTGDLGAFSLDTDPTDATLSDTERQTVAPGTYTVTEAVVAGWTIDDITCVDDDGNDSVVDVPSGEVVITVTKGEDIVCTFDNVRHSTITITKASDPVGATGFGFTDDIAAPNAFTLDDGQTETFTNVAPGTYTVTEDDPTGHVLTGLTCTDSDAGGTASTVDVPARVATINLDPGEDIDCRFTNSERGTITIEKDTDPAGGAGFGFTDDIGGANSFTLNDSATLSYGNVPPGTYTVTEDDPTPAFDLTGLTCADSDAGGTASTGDLGTRAATINLDPGETVTCTFTNTQRGTIEIIKATDPAGGTGFGFTDDVPGSGTFLLDDAETETLTNVEPGTYTVTEDDPTPAFDLTGLACVDSDAGGTASTSSLVNRAATINLDPGETVTCTYTNTERGSVTIEADAVPNDAQDFTFAGAFGAFTLDDDAGAVGEDATHSDSVTFADVVPGTHAVTQGDPSPATVSDISCNDLGSATPSSGDTGTRTATIEVDPGESVTCTFTNSYNAAPTITAPSSNATHSLSVAENQTAVTNIGSTDDHDTEGAGLTYSFTTTGGGGDDNGAFDLDTSSGLLDFTAAPDHENAADADNGNDYEVQVTVTDSGPGTPLTDTIDLTVNVTDLNDAPVVTPSAGTTAFTEGAGAVTADSTVAVTDQDDTALDSATVTITNLADTGQETLAATPSGAIGAGDISFAPPTLTIDPAVDAPIADFVAVLRSVTYDNSSNDPDTTDRVLRFVVNDGTVSSNNGDKTVSVTAVNDPPTLTAPGDYASLGNVGIDVPKAAGLIDGATVTDPDGSTFTVGGTIPTTTTQGGGLSISADGSFTYAPPPGYTGADTFDYQVCDNGSPTPSQCSAAKTATINVDDVIWFVDNSLVAAGNGTLATPFNSLAAFEAVNGGVGATDPEAGDAIFVFEGSADYTGGVTLENDQLLIGQGSGATLPVVTGVTTPTHSNTLPTTSPLNAPTVVDAAGDAIALGTGNTIRGLDIGDTPAANTGVRGTSVGTLTISDVAIRGTGGLIDISTGGTLDVTFDSLASTSSIGTAGINLTGVGGTFTVSNPGAGTDTSITGGDRGIRVQSAVSTATFSFGETSVTTDNSGGDGIDLATSSSATFTFDSLAVTTGAGDGLSASNAGTVTISGTSNTINATGGPALDLASTSLGTSATFASVSSSSSPTTGINLSSGVTGALTIHGGSISGASATAIDLDSVTGSFTYNGTVTNTAGRAVEVTNSGGSPGNTITFGGAIDEDGTGIRLDNNDANSGATVVFSGGMALDTGANTAFSATNGGTVNVTGSSNTSDTTSGSGLVITDTTIGASNVTFRSIASSGGTAPGIHLKGTGPSGRLIVTGDGATANSGGTIATKTGANGTATGIGILLEQTTNPSFAFMRLRDFTNFAIRGDTVAGLTISNSTITTTTGFNGNSTGDDEGSVSFDNLTGTASISNSTIENGYEDNLVITNTSGTLNATVTGSDIGLNNLNDGILVESQSNAVLNLTVTGTTFTGSAGDHIQCNAIATSTMDCTIRDNTFTNTHGSSGGGGVTIGGGSAGQSATLTYDVSGTSANSQTFNGAVGSAITVNPTNGTGTATGTIRNNKIGTSGVPSSGSSGGGAGIAVGCASASASLTHTTTIHNNDIDRVNGASGAIDLNTQLACTLNATVTNNTVNELDGFTLAALYTITGGGGPSDTATLCADVRGNTFDASASGGFDFFIDQLAGSSAHYRFPGYGGPATGGPTLDSFIANQNTILGFGDSSSAQNVTGAGCTN